MLSECLPERVSSLYRAFSDAEIEIVREKGVELNPGDPSLGEKRAVLLDDGEEVRDELWIRDRDGLPEERTSFCPSYIEHVAEAGEVPERHVVFRGSKCVGKARAVAVQPESEVAAGAPYSGELGKGVERPVLGGL